MIYKPLKRIFIKYRFIDKINNHTYIAQKDFRVWVKVLMLPMFIIIGIGIGINEYCENFRFIDYKEYKIVTKKNVKLKR